MIIFDSNYICYRAYFKMSYLSHDSSKTGIIYGFLREIFHSVRRFQTSLGRDTVVFAWDGKDNLRKKLYKPYKEKRKDTNIKMTNADFEQFDILRNDILPAIGFRNIFFENALEADDIIANLCLSYPNRKKMIISSDSDLFQLLTYRTFMYNPKEKKLFDLRGFKKEYGIKAKQWAMVKAIAGCNTDNVKGVVGVGEKTAAKYLAGNLGKHTKAYKDIRKAKSIRRTARNLTLVKLPFIDEKKKYKIKSNKLSYDALYSICLEYGFQSIIKDMKEWREILDLK